MFFLQSYLKKLLDEKKMTLKPKINNDTIDWS